MNVGRVLDRIFVTDSAAVTPENLALMAERDIQFISRLPATYKACGQAISEAVRRTGAKRSASWDGGPECPQEVSRIRIKHYLLSIGLGKRK